MSEKPAAQPCCCGETDERELASRLQEVIDSYRGRPGGLIPVLHMAQGIYGYLPDDCLRRISRGLGVPISEVIGVLSFYHFFSRTPKAKNSVFVCLGTACYVRGSRRVLDEMKKALSIDVGGCTADRQFSLNVARCFGACSLAPVIRINSDIHERMKPQKVARVLDLYPAKTPG
jgi:NADH:ubiquinone oxidoreductase subunit E